jgi:hypothetical protein
MNDQEMKADLLAILESIICNEDGVISDTIFMRNGIGVGETVCERIEGMLIGLGMDQDEIEALCDKWSNINDGCYLPQRVEVLVHRLKIDGFKPRNFTARTDESDAGFEVNGWHVSAGSGFQCEILCSKNNEGTFVENYTELVKLLKS